MHWHDEVMYGNWSKLGGGQRCISLSVRLSQDTDKASYMRTPVAGGCERQGRTEEIAPIDS